jgi:hypothetical protein
VCNCQSVGREGFWRERTEGCTRSRQKQSDRLRDGVYFRVSILKLRLRAMYPRYVYPISVLDTKLESRNSSLPERCRPAARLHRSPPLADARDSDPADGVTMAGKGWRSCWRCLFLSGVSLIRNVLCVLAQRPQQPSSSAPSRTLRATEAGAVHMDMQSEWVADAGCLVGVQVVLRRRHGGIDARQVKQAQGTSERGRRRHASQNSRHQEAGRQEAGDQGGSQGSGVSAREAQPQGGQGACRGGRRGD